MQQKIKNFIIANVFVFLLSLVFPMSVGAQWNPSHIIGTVSGNYYFNNTALPDNLIELISPVNRTGYNLVYQWESSLSADETTFTAITGATGATYSFSSPLMQTTYFRRKTTDANGSGIIYSNIIKIQVVSRFWENLNYVREHDVLVPNISDWNSVDLLLIGQKLQTTTYTDGVGRPIEKISKQTATPVQGSNTWGDVVQLSQYDAYGRQPLQYLPYTTTNPTNQLGYYKSNALNDQSQYYSSNYSDAHPYSQTIYDNSPLNRAMNVKSPGDSWNAGLGISSNYDLNDATDNVQNLSWVYGNSYPTVLGAYAANTLFKTIQTDENGKLVIQYTNNAGQLILKKVQLDDAAGTGDNGWICTYSVYDDYGRLRYEIQPEAVKWLDSHGWDFAAADAAGVLNEMCFRYDYDEKGRTILKKAPGAQPLTMIYDSRDRVVFMQDGNQAAKSTPEWTANIYDDVDRVTMVCLYHTSKSISDLQSDILAATSSTLTTTTLGQAIINAEYDDRSQCSSAVTAQNSITFDPGFSTNDGEEFSAYIDANTTAPSTTSVNTVFNNPISSADLNNPSVVTILKYLYYDDYSFTGAKPFDNNFNNSLAYSGDQSVYIPIATSQRTISLPTGEKIRVLNSNTFLTTTTYYDEKGRAIQTLSDNVKSGTDIITNQYHWNGHLLSSQTKHSTTLTGYNSFSILTKYLFDNIFRVTGIQKKYGDNDFKTIANYDFDDMGRLKKKHLDPGYTGSGKNEMESLAYSYNIHNQITGINKDYALKTSGIYNNRWDNFFGLYLGFDNKDNVFASKNLNGQVTGLLWNTQGDDAQRKYDYTYDNAGRLTKALFNEYVSGTGWNNAKMNFSILGNGDNQTIQYDYNGNLQSMIHKGVLPGQGVVDVDNLAYRYQQYSNKLLAVTDNGNMGSVNGQLGDFKDGTNPGNDYVYDNNGNVVVDLNKNATDLTGTGTNGISYNFLDKPELIRIKGKGLIQLIYDADGNKLAKIFTPENTNTATVTTYINQFVYTDNNVPSDPSTGVVFPSSMVQGELSYINFEEGRIRVMTPVNFNTQTDELILDGNMILPNGQKGAYDFFIRDYQQNVRMIVTEEVHSGYSTATMETADNRAAAEDAIFGQQGTNNEVEKTRATKPPGWINNQSNYVSMLLPTSLGGQAAIGPNSLLKVMAGDNISTTVDYYYQGTAGGGSSNNVIQDALLSLSGMLTTGGVTNGVLNNESSNIVNNLSPDVNTSLAAFADPNQYNNDGTPRAYLEVLFFDERFNFISENSSIQKVSVQGDVNANLQALGLTAPKNGYAYIFVSNESNIPVYFDNLKVTFTRGRLIEENHYYAYGLRIAAISSRKLGDPNEGTLANKNLYNDKEFFDDADLNWYDYGFRNYDAQIGRFMQLDPLTWEYPELTPYQYASCDPILNIDIDGLEGAPSAALSFFNGLKDQGFEFAKMGLISSGANAGKWVVSWVQNGIGMNQMFKSLSWLSRAWNLTKQLATSTAMILTSPIKDFSKNAGNGATHFYHNVTQSLSNSLDNMIYNLDPNSSSTFYSKLKESILPDPNNPFANICGIEGAPFSLDMQAIDKDIQSMKNIDESTEMSENILPKYENPGVHDPLSINFNKEKSIIPTNHEELFEQSQLGKDGNRWTKVGSGKKAVYHRFQEDGNGTWHWNGSTEGVKLNGDSYKIPIDQVPIQIRRQ